MYGIYLNWKCLKCGEVHHSHLSGCFMYQFDGGIAGYDYIETECSKCGEKHLVTTASRLNYIKDGSLINDYYYNAVVTREYAEKNNLKYCGVRFY